MLFFKTTAKALALALLALILFGCRDLTNPLYRQHFKPKPWTAPVQSSGTPIDEMEDGEIISKIESVAILPFLDETYGRNNTLNQDDSIHIAEELASHLIGSKTFRTILYPLPSLEKLSHTNLSIKKSDDIKEIANILGVDAIIFGVFNQYTMYYPPPQLSVSMKFYLTRLDRFASSSEISALAHSGIPLYQYNPTFFRQLWDTSAFYHGSSTIVKKKLSRYTKKHRVDFYGLKEDRILKTKADFLNFIAFDLSCSLNQVKKFDNFKKPTAFKKGPRTLNYKESYY